MKVQALDPLDELRRLVEKHGSQKAAATALGIGEVYMCDLLRGRRDVSEVILDKLGLRFVVVRK